MSLTRAGQNSQRLRAERSADPKGGDSADAPPTAGPRGPSPRRWSGDLSEPSTRDQGWTVTGRWSGDPSEPSTRDQGWTVTGRWSGDPSKLSTRDQGWTVTVSGGVGWGGGGPIEAGAVTPEAFKLIEVALVRMEHMHYECAVIHKHPLTLLFALNTQR